MSTSPEDKAKPTDQGNGNQEATGNDRPSTSFLYDSVDALKQIGAALTKLTSSSTQTTVNSSRESKAQSPHVSTVPKPRRRKKRLQKCRTCYMPVRRCRCHCKTTQRRVFKDGKEVESEFTETCEPSGGSCAPRACSASACRQPCARQGCCGRCDPCYPRAHHPVCVRPHVSCYPQYPQECYVKRVIQPVCNPLGCYYRQADVLTCPSRPCWAPSQSILSCSLPAFQERSLYSPHLNSCFL